MSATPYYWCKVRRKATKSMQDFLRKTLKFLSSNRKPKSTPIFAVELQLAEKMEDEQSKSSWIKSARSSTGFSSRSLMIRQLLAAAYGLLVNFIITQFLVRFVDEDFRNWSLKRTLVLSLVSMLLAFIFRKLKKYLQSESYGGEYSEVDGAAPGLEVSADYSAFTCFRFPALDQNPQRLMPAGSEGTIRKRGHVSEALGPSSLLEQPQPSHQPPPPSYQLQWVTSSPSSYSHQRFLPLSESSSFRPASLPRLASSWPVTQKKSMRKSTPHNTYRNQASNINISSSELGPWAFHFLEEHNFAEFRNEYSRFRNINISSFHHHDAVREEASPPSKSEASDTVTVAAPVSAGREYQLQRPAAAQVNAFTEPKRWSRKTAYKGGRRKDGCLERFLSSFCIQTLRRKQEQRRRHSRRFIQITPVAPFSSPQW